MVGFTGQLADRSMLSSGNHPYVYHVLIGIGFPEESEKFFTLAWPAQLSNDVLPLAHPPLPDVWSAARLPNAT
jgi:hypothetical protein